MITCSIRQGDWWRSAHAPQRYVHMGFAFFQCFLGAGIIFGWYVWRNRGKVHGV